MGVRIEDAGQHHLAACIVHVLAACREIAGKRDDLVAGDTDIGTHTAHAGDDQRPAMNHQVVLGISDSTHV